MRTSQLMVLVGLFRKGKKYMKLQQIYTSFFYLSNLGVQLVCIISKIVLYHYSSFNLIDSNNSDSISRFKSRLRSTSVKKSFETLFLTLFPKLLKNKRNHHYQYRNQYNKKETSILLTKIHH